jgi:hypothetical protein
LDGAAGVRFLDLDTGTEGQRFLCGNVLVWARLTCTTPAPRFLAARRGAGGRQAPGLQAGGSCGAMGWGLARYRLSGMGGKLLGQESCPVREHSTGQGRDCGWSAGRSASWPREGAGLTSSLGWEEDVKKRAFPFSGGRWGVLSFFIWSGGLWDRHGMVHSYWVGSVLFTGCDCQGVVCFFAQQVVI